MWLPLHSISVVHAHFGVACMVWACMPHNRGIAPRGGACETLLHRSLESWSMLQQAHVIISTRLGSLSTNLDHPLIVAMPCLQGCAIFHAWRADSVLPPTPACLMQFSSCVNRLMPCQGCFVYGSPTYLRRADPQGLLAGRNHSPF